MTPVRKTGTDFLAELAVTELSGNGFKPRADVAKHQNRLNTEVVPTPVNIQGQTGWGFQATYSS